MTRSVSASGIVRVKSNMTPVFTGATGSARASLGAMSADGVQLRTGTSASAVAVVAAPGLDTLTDRDRGDDQSRRRGRPNPSRASR